MRRLTGNKLARQLLLAIFAAGYAQMGLVSAGDLKLSCPSKVNAAAGTGVSLRCAVENSGALSALVLLEPASLEGPRSAKEFYLYTPIQWERFENVLQYEMSTKKTLDLPTMFHPVVHLRLPSLQHLARLRPGENRYVDFSWPLARDGSSPDSGKWLVRVKLIYLAEDRRDQLLREGALPPVCQAALQRTRNAPEFPKAATLSVARVGPRPFLFDGCHDVISERFEHLTSNTLLLEVR